MPNPIPASPFLEVRKRRRVLGYVANVFPLPDQDFAYQQVRGLADSLDAEARFAYTEPAEPGDGTGRHLSWLGHGLITPVMPHSMRADFEHFRHRTPARLAELLRLFAERMGMSEAEVADHPLVLVAISQARWAQAWAPDLVCSYYGYHAAMSGFVAASLLGIPRVHFLYPMPFDPSPTASLLQEYVARADLIVASDAGVANQVRAIAAKEVSDKLLADVPNVPWQRLLAAWADRYLVKLPPAATRVDLGPKASFTTKPSPPVADVGSAPVPFIVVCRARTGSNLLMEMLASHPRVVAAGELFNTRSIDEGRLHGALPDGLDTALLVRLRHEDPAACFDHLRAFAATRGAGAVGFKLMDLHAISENRIVDHLLGMPSLRVIHLTRADRLARYLSQARAEQSDSWWQAADKSTKTRPHSILLDAKAACSDFELSQQLEHRIRLTFENSNVLELSYEQLTADTVAQMDRVLDFLGLERLALQADSTKTGERDPRSLIANWRQLHDTFQGTRWGYLFHRAPAPSAALPCAKVDVG